MPDQDPECPQAAARLSAMNSISCIYGNILKHRINKYWTDGADQSGFRADRSCLDSIICRLRQVIEKRIAHNLESHIVFLDLQCLLDMVFRRHMA